MTITKNRLRYLNKHVNLIHDYMTTVCDMSDLSGIFHVARATTPDMVTLYDFCDNAVCEFSCDKLTKHVKEQLKIPKYITNQQLAYLNENLDIVGEFMVYAQRGSDI